MANHTPGPWRRNGMLIEGPKMALQVALVYPPTYVGNAPRNDDEFQANARLIAAAPDLLAALRDIAGYPHAGHAGLPLERARNLARAAIAKAETE